MESSPSSTNSNAEKTGESKSKKKSAEVLGSFAVLPEAKASDKKTEPLFVLGESKEKSQPTKPEESASSKDMVEALEKDSPVDQISDLEKPEAYREIARTRAQEIAEAAPAASEEQQEADAAAAAYLAHVAATGSPDIAAQETAQALDLEFEDEPEMPDEEVSSEETPLTAEDQEAADEEADEDEASASSGGAPPTIPPSNPPSRPFGGPPPPNVPNTNAPVPVAAANPRNPIQENAAYQQGVNEGLLVGGVVGGVVGYLIGRRRGRIKSEKRLIPIQQKLEKQVKSLQKEIDDNETAIRKAVIAKRRQAVIATPLPLAGRERPTDKERLPMAAPARPERIGKVVIAAEAPSSRIGKETSRQSSASGTEKMQKIDRHAATLSREELLAASGSIIVEGTSLRQIYETHLITEKGLRRLVAEHLKAGNVSRLLRKEIVEREIDFERDPILRDRARSSLNGSGKSALTSLVQQAGTLTLTNAQDNTSQNSQAGGSPRPTTLKQKLGQSKTADIALVTTIAVLFMTLSFLIVR